MTVVTTILESAKSSHIFLLLDMDLIIYSISLLLNFWVSPKSKRKIVKLSYFLLMQKLSGLMSPWMYPKECKDSNL